MGLRIFILTVLLGLLWSTGPYVYKGHKGCVECHTPHFETDGTCVDCHRGDPRSHRIHIAHRQLIQGKYACFTLPDNSVVRDGRRLIDTFGCRRCHKIGRQGNRLASNLDASLNKTPPAALARAIEHPAIYMPDFYFHQADVIRLVNAILASSAVYALTSGEDRRVIHFEKELKDKDNIFNNRCGSCHRVLTQQLGGLGQGDIGPNLSGIFSRFYFNNFKDGKSWNFSRLKRWLKNPRDIRMSTQMPPVRLKQDKFCHLLQILSNKVLPDQAQTKKFY